MDAPCSSGSQKGNLKKRVLTMVYHFQNYLVSGLFPSSGILETIKHDVSETGSVSVLRCGGEDTYSAGFLRQRLRLARSKGPN
jgi:hypothetical protein